MPSLLLPPKAQKRLNGYSAPTVTAAGMTTKPASVPEPPELQGSYTCAHSLTLGQQREQETRLDMGGGGGGQPEGKTLLPRPVV